MIESERYPWTDDEQKIKNSEVNSNKILILYCVLIIDLSV